MNPLDNLVPPEPFAWNSDDEAELQRLSIALRKNAHIDAARLRRLRRRKQKKDNAMSDSEDEGSAMVGPSLPGSAQTNGTSDKDQKQELVKLDPKEIGMTSGYKHLYSGKEDKHGRFQWQSEIPEDVGKPAEDAEAQKYAMLVRHIKVYNDPRRVLSMHSIVIQSPLLKQLLGEVLAGYPGVTVGLQRLEFSGRFEPLIHRWRELDNAITGLKDKSAGKEDDVATKYNHAKLLHSLLAEEFKEVIESSKDMMEQGVMTYELLWTLFQPGSHVYARVQGQDRVFRLHSSKYGADRNGNPVYWISAQYIDYDGTRFGSNKLNIQIPRYEGTKPIAHLAVFPLAFHTTKDDIKSKLEQRGAKMEALAGSHYRAYNGVGWKVGNMGQIEKYSIKGRIVIDGYGWNRFNPNYSVYVTALHIKDTNTAVGFGGGDSKGDGDDGYGGADYDGDGNGDSDDAGMPMDGFFVEEDDDNGPSKVELSEEQKLICSPFVRGYALKEKIWLNFFVNAVQEITFNTKAFESLVLPSNQKELILGFTATQQAYRSQFDDVIEGKGRGIILLLCGPPGVGKTLTAESVAEEMKVPLYMMSAGDLGLDPRHVESKLQGILDMCTRWNAILLLDEADVFLEERSLHELERNKLVSIFLRVLEYYEGIMFLTTNRVQTFDAAFQSRIHISIDYPELSIESRRTVWENFLKQHDIAQAASREKPLKPLVSAARSSDATLVNGTHTDEEKEKEAADLHQKRTLPHNMTKKDVDSLSLMNMNGRQIKNVLKTAQLLASKRGEGLAKTHVMTVLDVTQHLHNATREKETTRSSIFS